MKFAKKNIKPKNDDNLLPLVNIIFLLLIFFMIAGVVQKQKELYEVELGTAVIENYIDSDDKTIFIRKDGTIVFDGKGISDNELKTYLKEIEDKEKLDSISGLVLKVVISSLIFQIFGTLIFLFLFNINFDNNFRDNLTSL